LSAERLERWNARYRAGDQVFDTPAPLVVQFASNLAPGSALDLASGPGRNSMYLAGRGWRVTAVDGSPAAMQILLERAREKKLPIEAQVHDLETGEFDMPATAFDLVLSCYYLQRSLIPGMQSALRPGGLLIMIVHLADADQTEGTPARAYPGELPALFDGWPVLHYREGEPGESCHRHAVAELVARKPARE
jgi:SAM-dependent methyltransferase